MGGGQSDTGRQECAASNAAFRHLFRRERSVSHRLSECAMYTRRRILSGVVRCCPSRTRSNQESNRWSVCHRSGNKKASGARRAGQGRAAAKRTLDASKRCGTIGNRSDCKPGGDHSWKVGANTCGNRGRSEAVRAVPSGRNCGAHALSLLRHVCWGIVLNL
jgi:hypothetical protein